MNAITIFFWVFLGMNAAVWLRVLVEHALKHEAEQVAAVVPKPHPCAHNGHYYRAQPIVWRCAVCNDQRTTAGVFDQELAS